MSEPRLDTSSLLVSVPGLFNTFLELLIRRLLIHGLTLEQVFHRELKVPPPPVLPNMLGCYDRGGGLEGGRRRRIHGQVRHELVETLDELVVFLPELGQNGLQGVFVVL